MLEVLAQLMKDMLHPNPPQSGKHKAELKKGGSMAMSNQALHQSCNFLVVWSLCHNSPISSPLTFSCNVPSMVPRLSRSMMVIGTALQAARYSVGHFRFGVFASMAATHSESRGRRQNRDCLPARHAI